MTLWQGIFRRSAPAPTAEQRFSQLLTTILHRHRLMGEVLLQLPHRFDRESRGVMGLAWAGSQLVIEVNPARLAKMRQDDAALLLEHLSLHVVWEHPARYCRYPDQDLVRAATDIAVNQYLPAPPPGTASLAQLRRVLHRRVPAKLDSQEYLRIIRNARQAEQDQLRRSAGGPQAGVPEVESHAGWHTGNTEIAGDQQTQLAVIRTVVQRAWRQTPQRDRGLLPGGLRAQIEHPVSPLAARPNWQRLLRHQLGKIARGKRSRANRFNRRQPLRMDLPGEVSRLVPAVHLFVDNSGSVSDEELGVALLAIQQMTAALQLPVWLHSFDAQVHGPGQRLRPGQAPELVRHGGGGTRFQCVFDYLRDHHVPKTGTEVVIITDGWGERTLRDHHYRNVDWLLTTRRDQLSVPAPASRVFELGRKQNG
ncbi:DUF2201 family putative metallopeptidase [Limosilactobacillus antri]|uniref:vWA domain-containing protein n=1 Tax=Limosilactobacillus antri TaxID=227943 RepID=UPI001F56D128|nr:hypothetical protein [Limosilactobacillus antri]